MHKHTLHIPQYDDEHDNVIHLEIEADMHGEAMGNMVGFAVQL